MPATGDCRVASVESLLERGDLRGGGGDAGAGGVDFLGPGAGAQFGERLFRGPHAALRRGDAIPRHVPPRRRIVSLLARAGVVREQGLEAREILLGGVELGLRGRDVGARGLDLRLRLADVFDARAGLDQPQLRFGVRPRSARAR